MELRIAQVDDIEQIQTLQGKYHIDSIQEEDKKDGFITTAFTKKQLLDIIKQEQGIFLALQNGKVVGYIMSASWQFWSQWPMFAYMIKELPTLNYLGEKIDVNNSYQYGPVCIDKEVRGSGVLEVLFNFSIESMSKRYKTLITFVNKKNHRSFEAHKRKLGLDIIKEFQFKGNSYYEMAYSLLKR